MKNICILLLSNSLNIFLKMNFFLLESYPYNQAVYNSISKRKKYLYVSHNNKVNDYMFKTARKIINYCLVTQVIIKLFKEKIMQWIQKFYIVEVLQTHLKEQGQLKLSNFFRITLMSNYEALSRPLGLVGVIHGGTSWI